VERFLRRPWPATGMAASDTLDVEFTNISAQPVGEPGCYIDRPGFVHGGAGVAACWYGGARGVGRTLLAAAAEREMGPHALAHLGAVDIALHTARSALDAAAAEIDADPADLENGGRLRTLRLRALVEATATEVMHRVGRALGAAAFASQLTDRAGAAGPVLPAGIVAHFTRRQEVLLR
jgi:hypothetical protein